MAVNSISFGINVMFVKGEAAYAKELEKTPKAVAVRP